MSVQARVDWTNVWRALFGGLAVVAFLCIGFYFGTLHETPERGCLNQLDARVDDLEVDVFGGTASSEPTSVDDLVGRVQAVDEYLTDHPRAPIGERTEQAPPQPPSDGFTGGLEYVDEKDFKEGQEFGRNMPRIIVDGRKLDFSRHSSTNYVDAEFGIPVMWMEFGGDYMLSDQSELRAGNRTPDAAPDDNSLKVGDLVFNVKRGELLIVNEVNENIAEDRKAGKPAIWLNKTSPLKAGDPIHANAAKWLFSQEWISPDRSCGIARIGKTSLWAKFEGKGEWVIADPATFPDLLKQSAGEVAHVSAK